MILELADFLKTLFNIIEVAINMIIDFGSFIASSLFTAVNFIGSTIKIVPGLISTMFIELPKVFQYGIATLLCTVFMVMFFKLFQLIKGW